MVHGTEVLQGRVGYRYVRSDLGRQLSALLLLVDGSLGEKGLV